MTENLALLILALVFFTAMCFWATINIKERLKKRRRKKRAEEVIESANDLKALRECYHDASVCGETWHKYRDKERELREQEQLAEIEKLIREAESSDQFLTGYPVFGKDSPNKAKLDALMEKIELRYEELRYREFDILLRETDNANVALMISIESRGEDQRFRAHELFCKLSQKEILENKDRDRAVEYIIRADKYKAHLELAVRRCLEILQGEENGYV
jgi:hypothetical protein